MEYHSSLPEHKLTKLGRRAMRAHPFKQTRASSLVRTVVEHENLYPALHDQLQRNYVSMKNQMAMLKQSQCARYEEAFTQQLESHEKVMQMPTIRISRKNPAKLKLRAIISKRVPSPVEPLAFTLAGPPPPLFVNYKCLEEFSDP